MTDVPSKHVWLIKESCNVNAGAYLYCCCYLDLWHFQKVMKSGAILVKSKGKESLFYVAS